MGDPIGERETPASVMAGPFRYRLEPIVRLDDDGRFAGVYAYEALSSGKPPVGARDDFARFEAFVGRVDEPYRIHVNLYPSTIVAYKERIRSLLERPDEKKDIVVEIVESGGIGESLPVAANACNMQVSIDDFGTGSANFDRLFAIENVRSVKLDRHLWALEGSGRLIAELKGLLESRGVDVIAEKVEDRKDLDRLFRLGFRLFQGHLFNRSEDLAAIRRKAG